jgi:hypothetical protein
LSNRIRIGADVRAALANTLSPNRHRAQQLEKSLAAAGRLRPIDYWPHLQLIGCWKGGSVGVRLKELPAWFGDQVPTRDLGYMASEAQMSLPVSDSGSGRYFSRRCEFL